MIEIPKGKVIMEYPAIECGDLNEIFKIVKSGYVRITFADGNDIFLFVENGDVIGAYSVGSNEIFGKDVLKVLHGEKRDKCYITIHELKSDILNMIKNYYPQIFEKIDIKKENSDNTKITNNELKDKILSKEDIFEKFKIERRELEKEAEKIVVDFLLNVRGIDDLIKNAENKIRNEIMKIDKVKNCDVKIVAERIDSSIVFNLDIEVVYSGGFLGRRDKDFENKVRDVANNICEGVLKEVFGNFKIDIVHNIDIKFKVKGLI